MTLSVHIYSRLLLFYPEELRRNYGEEMALVFADDLRDADLSGVIRIWRNALAEFFQLGVLSFIARPNVRVPAFAIVFAFVSLTAAWGMSTAPYALRGLCAAILPTSNLPIIALICVWACRGRGVTSLNLSQNPPEEQ